MSTTTTTVPKINLHGNSGKTYTFNLYKWGTEFKALGAVYAILKKTGDSNYRVLYIGQTEDLSERFDAHHKASCFSRNGVTHIAIHTDSNKNSRLNKEFDLVANYNPVCNG